MTDRKKRKKNWNSNKKLDSKQKSADNSVWRIFYLLDAKTEYFKTKRLENPRKAFQ